MLRKPDTVLSLRIHNISPFSGGTAGPRRPLAV